MNERRVWSLVVILTATLVLNAGLGLAEERVLVNGIDADFPPFAFVDKTGVPDGFDVAVINSIAEKRGLKVEHRQMNWDGIIASLKAGKIDMIASGMSITDARKKEVDFTLPYYKISQVLVVPKDSSLTAAEAMSGGNRIGVQRGTTEAKWMEENLIKKEGKKFELVYYDSAPLSVEDVINGRIVAAAMDDAPAKDIEQRQPVKVLGTFGMPEEEFGYAVRKEDGELLKTLEEGLKEIMASPEWDELKKKYGVE